MNYLNWVAILDTLKETLPWIAKAVVSVLIGFQATKVVGTFLLNNTSLLVVVVGGIVVTAYGEGCIFGLIHNQPRKLDKILSGLISQLY